MFDGKRFLCTGKELELNAGRGCEGNGADGHDGVCRGSGGCAGNVVGGWCMTRSQ